MRAKTRVLFLCTGNSARSQMAEGLLRKCVGGDFEVHSAGTHPSAVRCEAVQAMEEIGIDIRGHRSKSVLEFAGQNFDYAITVCDQAAGTCPSFAGAARRLHWSIADPADLADFRYARKRLEEKIRAFLADRAE